MPSDPSHLRIQRDLSNLSSFTVSGTPNGDLLERLGASQIRESPTVIPRTNQPNRLGFNNSESDPNYIHPKYYCTKPPHPHIWSNLSGNYIRHVYSKPATEPLRTLPQTVPVGEYYPEDVAMYSCGGSFCSLEACAAHSGDSLKTRTSARTVSSKKSSQELRDKVLSMCKLHDDVDRTLRKMSNSKIVHTPSHHPAANNKKDRRIITTETFHLSPRYNNTKASGPRSDRKIAASKNTEADLPAESPQGGPNTLTMSIDELVNTKVINPFVRKMQRMYLRNIKDELALMEDLSGLPNQVHDVYKKTSKSPEDD